MTENDRDTRLSAGEDTEPEKPAPEKPKLRISHITAGICALLIAAAAGAAIVADLALKNEDAPRIYGSSSLASEAAEAAGADSSDSKDNGSASENRKSEAAAVTGVTTRKTAAKTTTVRKTSASKTRQTKPSKTVTSKTASSTAGETAAYVYPQDINTADIDCLAGVNGINRTVAGEIAAYRERHGAIHNFEELLDIYGVGERTLSVIREHFYISDADYIAYTRPVTEPLETRRETEPPPSVTTAPPVSETVRTTASASKTTAPAKTTEASSETTSETTSEPKLRTVNINTAEAGELAEALLLSPETAEAIVELRKNIGSFVNDLELLYVSGFSEKMLVERRPYIRLSDSGDSE